MKFEIDPNELTTDQRAHVAAFITNWPINAVRQERINQMKSIITAPEFGREGHGSYGSTNTKIRKFEVTEEERLDTEQKSDMCVTEQTKVNLNAIFGSPPVHCPSHVDYDPNATIPVVPSKVPSVLSVPLDKEGLPWDSRIHASTKTFVADGTWKLRRGVDPVEVDTVKKQLKGLMAVPVVGRVYAGTLPIPPEDIKEFKDEIKEYLGAIPTPTPEVTIGSASHVPVPPAPVIIPQLSSHYLSNQAPAVTLTDLIGRMSKAIAENRLTQANVTEMCVKHGVSEFFLLSNRPDLLPLIDADMKAMGV